MKTLPIGVMNMVTAMTKAVEMINDYLGNGGFFNPEHMDHQLVRDLLLECRKEIVRLQYDLDITKECVNVAEGRMHSNWSYHRWWEEKFAKHLVKIKEWEDEETRRLESESFVSNR